MKRLLFVVVVLLLAVGSALPGEAAKTYRAERYDVEWTVQEGGSLLVTETAVFRFEGGPFTYVYREIPDDFTDGISDIRAALDGAPLAQGSGERYVEIKGRGDTEVRWHFPPTNDSTHMFTLSYRVDGVVRREAGADLLWWNALPTDHDYTIDESTLRINWPAGIEPQRGPEIRRGAAEASRQDKQIVLVAQNVRKDGPLTVALAFPPGSLVAAPPRWQARSQAAAVAAPGFLISGGLLLLAGTIALAWLFRRHRPQLSSVEPLYSLNPPDGLLPALGGVLATPGAQPAWPHALAALFDLARRGALTIDETDRKWYRSPDFVVREAQRPSGLRPQEEGMLDILFTDRKGRRRSDVRFSQLAGEMSGRIKLFAEPLKAELRLAGLYSPERERDRKGLMWAGVGLLILSGLAIPAAIPFLDRFGGWPFIFAVVFFILSMIAFVLSVTLSPLSPEGEAAAGRWRAYGKYLKNAAKGSEMPLDQASFERIFPFAAALGLAREWAKGYEKGGGEAPPAWFNALAGPAGGSSNVAFVAMISASHSAGGSSSGGAGGGGAGGGGGSGAG